MSNCQQQPKAPLVVITLMVKNEACSIQATLSSLFDGGMRFFFVLDTGSTDNTVELINHFFQNYSVEGVLRQEPFIDFAQSRNRTLVLAEQYFPDALFFLMPDAEWFLHNAQRLIMFCEQERYSETPLYLLTAKMNLIEFATARLLRVKSGVRFKGVVHEVPEVVAREKVPDPVYFEILSSSAGKEKSKKRWEQDLLLLLSEYDKNPQATRNAFYLAQTYECLGDTENAFDFYQKRMLLSGWDEENYMTLLRLGYLAKRIRPWSVSMDYLLKAFSLRPHRIEPLLAIADYYWPDNAQTCYLFTRYAYDIPYPEHDLLFVEKEAYTYTRYELMSRCAWYMGEYALGEQATLLALKAYPQMEHLQRNLGLYQQKLRPGLVCTSAVDNS